jgi:hypothetical protein
VLALAGLLLAVTLVGCGAVEIERVGTPAVGEEARAQRCARQGGWWQRDDLMGGFCEFQSPGML